MKVSRAFYDALKSIQTNQGSTKGVEMETLDLLVAKGLITQKPIVSGKYEFNLTDRGKSAIDDTPIQ